MSKVMVSMLLLAGCGASLADECRPPTIVQEAISHRNPAANTMPVIFERYKIYIHQPTITVYARDILIYVYGHGKNKKVLSIQPILASPTGRHKPFAMVQDYKRVFGLVPTPKVNFTVVPMRTAMQLCNGSITQYALPGMHTPVIKTNVMVGAHKNTVLFVFNDVNPQQPRLSRIQFAHFTDEEIAQVLSSWQNVQDSSPQPSHGGQ